MTLEKIKRISIREYLSSRGISPIRENKHTAAYLSPLREDKSPSFSLNLNTNLWFDHGIGEGGSIIDLVAMIERCSIGKAISRLENSSSLPIIDTHPNTSPRTIEIRSVKPLTHPALLDYLSERKVDLTIAQKYCSEVRYTVGDKEYFSISFGNDAEGWELRNRHFKGCSTPKHITTISNGSDSVMVFEGFIDFLSYLSLKENPSPTIDTTVLNSVANLAKAIPFLQGHKTVHTFLDNDEAGKRAVEQLRRSLPNSEVVDQSAFYRNYKDLNEYLTGQQLAKCTPNIAKPQPKEVVKIKPRGRKM